MFVIAAPAWSLILLMWYSNGPGNASNFHPKREPQNSRPFAVSSAGISMWTGCPAMVPPFAFGSAEQFPRSHHMTGWSRDAFQQTAGPAATLQVTLTIGGRDEAVLRIASG